MQFSLSTVNRTTGQADRSRAPLFFHDPKVDFLPQVARDPEKGHDLILNIGLTRHWFNQEVRGAKPSRRKTNKTLEMGTSGRMELVEMDLVEMASVQARRGIQMVALTTAVEIR